MQNRFRHGNDLRKMWYSLLHKGDTRAMIGLTLAISSLFQIIGYTQPASYKQGFPTIGYKCPDAIFRNIKFSDKNQASVKSFRGRWLMIDFFNKHCGACVASFPHVDSIYREYKEKLQVIMVGTHPDFDNSQEAISTKEVEEMYEQYRQKEHLSMPVAFDPALAMQWDIYAAPYIIILDDKGIVRAITVSCSRKKLDSLLAGYLPAFYMPRRTHEDFNWPELKPYRNEFSYNAKKDPDPYKGPRFAVKNHAPFPMKVNFDDPYVLDDSLNSGQMSKFYEGDYRRALQVTNIYYNLQYGDYRGTTCAMRYKPARIKDTLPAGDWVIHFYYRKGWKYRVSKIKY